MRHVDPDTLALLALGESVESAEESAHLAACPECALELASFTLAARVGRESLTSEPLDVPHDRVWERIAGELQIAQPQPQPQPQPLPQLTPRPQPQPQLTPRPTPIAARPRRRLVVAVAAAAAVVALVAAGGAVWVALTPSAPTVLATAQLDALPQWPTASGSARLERLADGSRVVRVTLDAPVDDGGFREAWLITSDASALVSLGVMRDGSATFAVPDGIDTSSYDLVDVSEEAFDGDPAHSGDSIVRGALRAD